MTGNGDTAVSGTAPSPEGPAALSRPLSYYDGATGYDVAFLGTAVPLPVLTEAQRRTAARWAAPDGHDPAVLPYRHFSIVLDGARQQALFTVVNVDGAQLRDLPRERDRWSFDPRIAESEQIGEELYRRNALDRGHLVRRLDPVWGPSSERAAEDTFHFTNCSPQHERFNQGRDLWLGLEEYLLDHAGARRRRLTVFCGPVLHEDDPLYKGVRLPLAYWKVIVYDRTDGGLAAAGYVLEQGKLIEDVLRREAVFDPGTYRVTLEHLAGRTGLALGPLEPAELPLSSDGLEVVRERVLIRPDYANVVV